MENVEITGLFGLMPGKNTLQDGPNLLPTSEIFEIISNHKFVKTKFTVSISDLKEKRCPSPPTPSTFFIILSSVLVLMVINIVYVPNRRRNDKQTVVEENPDYNRYEDNVEYIDTVFTDQNDYYD